MQVTTSQADATGTLLLLEASAKAKSEVDSNLNGSPPPLLYHLVTLSWDRGQTGSLSCMGAPQAE